RGPLLLAAARRGSRQHHECPRPTHVFLLSGCIRATRSRRPPPGGHSDNAPLPDATQTEGVRLWSPRSGRAPVNALRRTGHPGPEMRAGGDPDSLSAMKRTPLAVVVTVAATAAFAWWLKGDWEMGWLLWMIVVPVAGSALGL